MLRCFQDQGHGSLIHLSSIQGVQAPKFEHYVGTGMSSPIEYAAIKSGIISITRWLAKYAANQNIRVNCVSPGGILDAQPEEFLRRYRQSCTNIGMLSAEQVASAIAFLLSPGAAAINGQNIIVDDGWTL
jgi:NAD(P)-dependent dehydrogenase (short-subunit alcohol dehydrogenase family)